MLNCATVFWYTFFFDCNYHQPTHPAYTLCILQRVDAIRHFTSVGHITIAASYDVQFGRMVRQINERFDTPFERINATTFRDYSSGLTTLDVQDLRQG